MARRLIGILEVISGITILGAGLAVGAGLLIALQGVGATGMQGLSLPIGLFIAGVGLVGFVPGVTLRRAAAAIRETSPELPASTPQSRLVSTAVAGFAVLASAAPLAVGFPGTGRIDALPVFQMALGVILATCAWAARYLPGRPLGDALLGIALVGGGLGAWQTSAITGDLGQQQVDADEKARREAMYAPIREGPTAGEIARALPEVGSWLAVTGGVEPDIRGDEYPYGPKDALGGVRGREVRLAAVGQCWNSAAASELVVVAFLAQTKDAEGNIDMRRRVELPALPCDGEVHVTTSEVLHVPDWLDMAARPDQRQEWLGATGDIPIVDPGEPFPDHAERWMLYVSAEPGSSVEELRAAVDGQVEPLVLTPLP